MIGAAQGISNNRSDLPSFAHTGTVPQEETRSDPSHDDATVVVVVCSPSSVYTSMAGNGEKDAFQLKWRQCLKKIDTAKGEKIRITSTKK